MNEPSKKPEKAEPTISNIPEIKTDANEPVIGDIKPTPAAANGNEEKREPVVGATPVVDLPGAKKDPVVVIPVSVPEAKTEPVVPPAAPVTAPSNDNPVVADNNPPVVTDKPAAPVATPVAETPAATPPVPPAAPTAEAPAAAADAAAPVKKDRLKGFLKGTFNFVASAAVGAASSLAIKATLGTALASAGVPVFATLVATSLAIGVAAGLIADVKNRHKAAKEGKELSKYFSRAHAKELFWSKRGLTTIGISTAGALLGGALALGFKEGIIQNAWHNFWHHAPTPPVETAVIPAVVPPVEHVVAPPPPVEHVVVPPVETVQPPVETVIAPPVPVHCITPVEQFNTLISGHHVSPQVTDALHRAASDNARIAAQGTKDLAFYAQNGFGGVPKDHQVALELFKKAADAGNLQARTDMLYLQHYGLDHVAQDKASSLAAMKDIHTAKAGEFVKAWGGAGKTLPHVDFDSNTILKGLPVGCPVPG